MIKNLFILFFCASAFVAVSTVKTIKTNGANIDFEINNSLDSINFNDGPYVIINKDSLIELNIVDGNVKSKAFGLNTRKIKFDNEISTYNNINKIAALSDLHGQYDLTIKILINNGLIDKNLNWTFGKGHLVFVGDIFDRGPKVTELLWFVLKLETQALKSGGKVHYMLGNHEYMVMQNDLRYINKKYRKTELILKTPYNKLYDNNTLIGRWLRSKTTILKINDNLFVHGGISQELIDYGFDLEGINHIMRQSLYEDEREARWDSLYGKFYDNFGPIWYRGYFNDSFKKRQVNKILRQLDVHHIIVGHTSQTKIESLFRNKIFAVDSSIKLGETGEILFIEDGKFSRRTMDGKKIEFKKKYANQY